MRFPKGLKVFGDPSFRGDCRKEQAEQIDAFAWLRFHHPELAKIAVHPKIEGKRSWGQVHFDKKDGSINKGASDVIVPANPAFVCEIKRKDHTKSRWQKGQKEYLETATDYGAFACVALGAEGFKQAVNEYLAATKNREEKTNG
jgi:hypothetical protein